MTQIKDINREMFDTKADSAYSLITQPGLTKELITLISKDKHEPQWMLDFRLSCLALFYTLPLPSWEGAPSLDDLDLSKIIYYSKPDAQRSKSWDDVPAEIKKTFDRLGIPEAERKALAGAGAQFESSVVYHNLKKQWEEKGVIFEDCDVALQKYPELMKKYFMKCVSPALHKFAALHGATWSGGTFLYVPAGVKIDLPLQAYFRMNEERMGQFEHTLIIAEPGSEFQYLEGCSAPKFSQSSLHAGCVEIFVHKDARVRYSSIENWSKNTYNLNTKRAIVEDNGVIEWVNGNMGSKTTYLYPCSILKGSHAKSDFLGVAFAGKGQHQDTGCKVYHLAPYTSSTIRSKSISKDGGISTYRGLVHVAKNASHCKVHVQCDALMADASSQSQTIPYMDIQNKTTSVAHEATVTKISADQIFYLMSRGLSHDQARQMVVSGFIDPISKTLPVEHAVELNRLIELEMEDAIA